MWIWLGIVVLAQVAIASQEIDSLSYQVPEDGGKVELQGEELPRESTIKPATKTRLVEWKDDHIFEEINPYENSIAKLIGELSSSESKEFPNVQRGSEDERDKRSPTKGSQPASPGPWTTWMTFEDKAQPFRNLQDPWQEIKKSRAFSPWGGKRVTVFGQGPKVRRPIRVPFNSWGGKRSFSDAEKRTRFSSWGGKRGWYLGGDENGVENGGEKRTKFNAWGGKRSKNGDRDDEEIKRNRFNAWGGKRNDKTEKRRPEEVGAKKSVFNAWGGKKRFFNGDETNLEDDEKGLKYDRWRGKVAGNMFEEEKPRERTELEENINKLVDENGDEENEVPIESGIIELQEKRGGSGNDYVHKSLFNPWGGKKRGENNLDEIAGTGLNLILPESHHNYGRFWSWGG